MKIEQRHGCNGTTNLEVVQTKTRPQARSTHSPNHDQVLDSIPATTTKSPKTRLLFKTRVAGTAKGSELQLIEFVTV
eukprot:5802796-Amphidinium_carterae.1